MGCSVNRETYVMRQHQEKYSTCLKKGRTDFSIGDLDYFYMIDRETILFSSLCIIIYPNPVQYNMMNAETLPPPQPPPPGSVTDRSYFSPRVHPHGPERLAFPASPLAPLMLSRAGRQLWVSLRFLPNAAPSHRPRTCCLSQVVPITRRPRLDS